LRTKLTARLGIQHPLIQAGMRPFSNNNLCVAGCRRYRRTWAVPREWRVYAAGTPK